MKADLDKILELLDVEYIARTIHTRHIVARERFTFQHLMPQNEDDFFNELTLFYQHQIHAVKGHTLPDWEARFFVRKILESKFKNNLKDAFNMAAKGKHGGMRKIVDFLFTAILSEHERQHISHVFMTYLDTLDFWSKVNLMEQYLRRFARNLPPGSRPKSAVELASQDVEAFILIHTEAVESMRGRLAQ